ncbi:MAG: 4-hydroxy-3-methylbut-2-en-1-yl diphosphate synthase [Pelagibacterales bacterium]|nr:4-hydroxy-3-methylbut-2-en-1-yl diphosphate synthase [Pelagibacterales bacterium]OUU61587.1 MAG: 4-hydroxy-3-methylbut-2-en-1-yl diphosphate synthase [Alphaproteobacteria bacterium TMED62]
MRRKTKQVNVGKIKIGSNHPISVQSMTNTLTTNVEATVEQIKRLENAGADLVRVSCPDRDSTIALKKIISSVNVPIIADIHFHYKRAIEAADVGASCLRINPGNIGSQERVAEVVKAAKHNNCSIRVGVNAGSLEKKLLEKYKTPTPDALLESALHNIYSLEKLNFYNTKVSVKASNIDLAVASYRLLAKKTDYPLHLGITEAGGEFSGTVKSSIGLGILLAEGIVDTIRVSLSDDPVKEIKVGLEILKSLNIRKTGITIISCPSCARQQFDVIKTVKQIENKFSWVKDPISISILGCVVNGPGEAMHTDIGVTGGGNNNHQIYINGEKNFVSKNKDLVEEISILIEKKLTKNG